MNTFIARSIQIPLIILMIFVFSMPIFADQDYTQVLADRVEAELANYYMDEFEIRAEADGHVWIEGEVNTLYDKYRVYEIVSKVPGVRIITNNLIVDTPTLPDKIVKDNIRDEMKYVSSIIEPERINIHVDNGVVILTGQVSYEREKAMARTVASW